MFTLPNIDVIDKICHRSLRNSYLHNFGSDPLMNEFKSKQHNTYQHIHILTSWKVFTIYFSTILSLCAFHWHCLRYDMSHHITSYLTVSSTTHSCWHQAFTLLTLCEGVGHRWIPSETKRLIWILLTHLLIWQILCAVLERYFCNRIPQQLHVGPSVILCLIDIEHWYGLIQCENVVLILFWYRRIGTTGVDFLCQSVT